MCVVCKSLLLCSYIYYELINHCLGEQFEDETFKIKMAIRKCWL